MGPLMMSRPMFMAAAACGAFIAVFLALIWTKQRRLIYFPTSGVPTPAEIGLTDVERVTFETTDGLRLSGWFVAASGTSPRVTVVVFDGNAGNPGTPTERGLAADGRAARAYLAGRPDVDPSRSCTSASRWEQPWRSASPLSTRRQRSFCDRRSHRWPTWGNITIRSCRCACFSGTARGDRSD